MLYGCMVSNPNWDCKLPWRIVLGAVRAGVELQWCVPVSEYWTNLGTFGCASWNQLSNPTGWICHCPSDDCHGLEPYKEVWCIVEAGAKEGRRKKTHSIPCWILWLKMPTSRVCSSVYSSLDSEVETSNGLATRSLLHFSIRDTTTAWYCSLSTVVWIHLYTLRFPPCLVKCSASKMMLSCPDLFSHTCARVSSNRWPKMTSP